MASEIIHDSYDDCNQYFSVVREEMTDLIDVKLQFTCVEAGLLEEYL